MRRKRYIAGGVAAGRWLIPLLVVVVSPCASGQSLVAPSLGGGAADDGATGALLNVGQGIVGSVYTDATRLEAGVMFCYVDMEPGNPGFFDDFEDDYLDPCDWWPSETEDGSISEASGVLTLRSERGRHARVYTMRAFEGDFDVEVDFALLAFPNAVASHAGLRVFSAADTANAVVLKRNRQWARNTYHFFRYVNGVLQGVAVVDSGDMFGKFRIKRTGTQFTAYRWRGAWISLGSTNHFAGPARMALDAFGTLNNPTVSAAYDNFNVVADGVSGEIDLDFDGDVDMDDFAVFVGCLGEPDAPAASLCAMRADLDCDRDVDLGDYALFQQLFTRRESVGR